MLIEYKNAKICQTDGKVILADVNFNAGEGEFIYLIGGVGTGKSSLLKTMYFELVLDEAYIAVVLNLVIKSLKRKHVPALRRQMGIIFQDFQLLADRTVRRNLEFVLKATGWKKKDEIEARVKEVLAEVGMEEKIDQMPHELSGGEQQRVASARAILNKPKVTLADQPTGKNKKKKKKKKKQLLRNISKTGTSVVMSHHNIKMFEKYNSIVNKCTEEHIKEVNGD